MKSALRMAAFGCAVASSAAAQPLPTLNLDPEQTTVSGLSSGGFMAVQMQVAFSKSIAGAGIVAGGPYGCADGNVYRALRVCMNGFLGTADAEASMQRIEELVADGRIDAAAHLSDDRVYLFHGLADDTVARETMDALRQLYVFLGVDDNQVVYETGIDAGHGFVTEQAALTCSATDPDFLIDCDFDQAGDILGHLYGALASGSPPRDDALRSFAQTQYLAGAQGMDALGYVYIPPSCAQGRLCRLHIALHGCKQGRDALGDTYATRTGYNAWAETNALVILYPQAKRIPAPWWNWFGGNPNGCWDWWGYAGDDHLTQTAPQIAAVARMAAALGAPLSP